MDTDWLYYVDFESHNTDRRKDIPPMSEYGKPQDPQVTWEPVVKVYSSIRGFDNGVPHRVDTWRHARRVSCPHCGMQHFYRSIEERTQELSQDSNIYCLYCKKIFHWPLAQNDDLVQGTFVDTPSTHYEAYTQEDLGEWKEPVTQPTIPCNHLIAAEKALYDNGIGINLYGEIEAFCYHCKQNMPIQGPVIGVPNSVAWERQR